MSSACADNELRKYHMLLFSERMQLIVHMFCIVVFSGDIDAVKVDKVKGNSYVEFKTTKDFRREKRHRRNFDRFVFYYASTHTYAYMRV
jgi:hypothetical protein